MNDNVKIDQPLPPPVSYCALAYALLLFVGMPVALIASIWLETAWPLVTAVIGVLCSLLCVDDMT